ncbi:MAG TPA: indolepyruvate oxidoreductase subunit beta [Sedimentisphaerales bacterium]|nr:indolepyruvate oxidoreductase subunit beta [Sedimentisphaerales bacterium]
MADKVYNITFGGVGGQGILKAAEICGCAAMFAGYHVKKSEVHGMAQRGGSVESHIRFGKKVFSPLISPGGADCLVCFHPEEHARLRIFLKPGGIDLTGYLEKANDAITNPRCLNTFLVGVLSAKLPLKQDCWIKAIEMVFKKKVVEENKREFLEGRKIGQS